MSVRSWLRKQFVGDGPWWPHLLATGSFALVLFVWPVFDVARTLLFRAGAAQADGVVVALAERRSQRHHTLMHLPVFEFTDANGRPHRVEARWAQRDASHAVGEQVRVFYDPLDPDRARLDGFEQNYSQPVFLGAFGVPTAAWFLAVLAASTKQRKLRARLRHEGVRTACTYDGVELKRGWYRLGAYRTDPRTGVEHRYWSDWGSKDPTAFVPGDTVEVLVDPRDPAIGWVDIEAVKPRHQGTT